MFNCLKPTARRFEAHAWVNPQNDFQQRRRTPPRQVFHVRARVSRRLGGDDVQVLTRQTWPPSLLTPTRIRSQRKEGSAQVKIRASYLVNDEQYERIFS